MKRLDNVNHPKHYETGKFECIEVMEEALGIDVVKGFCLGNAFKYIYRCNSKHENNLIDIKKAHWYIERYIQLSKKSNTPKQKVKLPKLLCKFLKERGKRDE